VSVRRVGGHLHHPGHELTHRHEEAQKDRHKACCKGRPAPHAREAEAHGGPEPARALVEAGPPPLRALDQDEGEDEHQKRRRKPDGRGPVAQRKPGAEDPRGEGRDPEVLDGAVLVQDLHEDQGEPRHDSRARHGKRHAEKGAPRPLPQNAGALENAFGLLLEGGPADEVDVRVEHEGHDHPRPRKRHERGAEPGRGGRLEHGLERQLHRPVVRQDLGVREGHDVGGHGQRENERPGEDPPPRKVAGGHEPGGGDAHDQGHEPHPHHERQGVHQVEGEHGRGQVLPGLAPPREHAPHDHRRGQQDQRHHHPRGHGPGRDRHPEPRPEFVADPRPDPCRSCGQRHPARSKICTASLFSSPRRDRARVSARKSPHDWRVGVPLDPLAHGVLVVPLGKGLLGLFTHQELEEPERDAGFGACRVMPAPLTFTCVPRSSWFGKITPTCAASAREASSSAFRRRPT
jgi:hypothetical protein